MPTLSTSAADLASGHPDQAIPDFDQAIRLQPDFPQTYTHRGNAYLRLGRLGLTMDDFRRAGSNPMGSVLSCVGMIMMAFLLRVTLHSRFVLSKKGNK